MDVVKTAEKLAKSEAEGQPKVIVRIMINPDNSIGVASVFTEKALVLEALLGAVKAVALGAEHKPSAIIKPSVGQVMKVNN